MAPQDTFIDDEDDTCPLCIEELDLSDRNFRPCPCGYQVCQFCFNNIKNNMSGLCPACRRPYDEKTIQWKVVTQEEIAEFKANLQKNQKKKAAEQRQKEVQKREAERENRKNLVGVRVVQKNLVYVTGLTPTVREDELLKTLRKPEFFGQYGNIHKISISNRRTTDGQTQSLGIYVTFEKKEDAARCIQAVNGSQNGERTLKAQLGTTKYCSAWLRYEQCTNRQCMFLHELGDEEDSYTRQDLSSMNSIVTQRPLPAAAASRSGSRQQGLSSSAQPASQQMTVTASKDGSDNDDTPALPSTANWARSTQQRSRRGSHATSGAASSPAVSTVLPVTAESVEEAVEARTQEEAAAQAPAPEPSMRAKAAAKPVEPKKSSKRDSRDDLVSSLIKAICLGKDAFPFSSSTANNADQSFPPLFDPRGGEKRRAMRDEEEARLGIEQEEAVDTDEPSEGEPERGGSLALGGEPEDRDQGRQSSGFGSRAGSAQLPIRRAGAEGIFGQPLGANNAQGVTDLGSIGSRNLTPQQQSFLRGQSIGLRDGMHPGIGAAQSTLFQGQGHSRQGSRFSFANENASASASVKLAANPRIMAQQSSMMPTAFHNQANTSFYTSSSMPGPPPGLKSTGTPPGIFGGQGFGSGGFGSSTRDSGELLQSLIGRKSAAPGGSQSLDASKREYQLSQFPTQYPYQGGSGAVPSTTSPYHSTLSSPAPPATGLMASLYGPSQPVGSGAFPDANSAAKHLKQQRKGKKHRHANTSSSGGSALVDLGADPSILRMQQHHAQHQQQSGPNSAAAGSAGQGLFGGQSQAEEDTILSLDEATARTVDDLVADDEDDDSGPEDESQNVRAPHAADPFIGPSAPPFPPGFGFGFGPQRGVPMQFGTSPANAPFGQPGMQAPLGMGMSVPIGPPLPAIPLNPATPPFPSFAFGRKPPTGPSSALSAAGPGSEAKRSIKALAVESGLSKDIAAQSSKPQQPKKVLQDEDFPALGDAKPSVAAGVSASAVHSKPAITKPVTTPGLKKTGGEPSTAAILSKPGTPLLERKLVPPAGLTPVDTAVKPPAAKAADMVSNPAELEAAFPALPTPNTASANKTPAATPAARPAPKTLRVLPTSKIEQTAAFPPVSAIRAGSVSTHRPDTPISEIISDSASIVSASVSASRTNSPPPTLSKVGTAPVRATTKSQQRKQRKEAATTKTQSPATTSAIPAAAPHPKNEPEVIAPIIGRKKKQKKEKTTSSTAEATPESRSESRSETPVPTPAAVPAPSAAVKEDLSTYRHVAGETMSLTETASPVSGTPAERLTPVKTRVTPIGSNMQDTVEITSKGQDSPSTPSFREKDANGEISLEALFRDLLASGEIPELSKLAFLKPGSATSMYHQKSNSQSHAHPPSHPQHNNYLSAGGNGTSLESFSSPRPVMTEADRAALHAGNPVRKTIDGMRVLLTPNGDCVRDLTEEEEDRYLKLQADVARDMDTPAEFFSERYSASGGFSLIKGRAVPNGRPTYFPNGGTAGKPAASGATMDPLAKMQREDAITYINQYVLPRLNLGNANFGFPGSWMGSNDPNRSVPPAGGQTGAVGHNMAVPSFPVTADSAGALTTSARSEILSGLDTASLGLPPYNPYGPGMDGQYGYGQVPSNGYCVTDSPTTDFGGGNHPYSTADELASLISLPGGALDQLASFPVNTGMVVQPDPASAPSNLAAMLQSASENMFKAAGEGIVRDHLMAAARAAEASGRSLDGVTAADISVAASIDQPGTLSGSLPPTLTVSDKAPDSLRDILKPLGLDGTSSPFVKNDKGEWTVDEKIVRELAGKLMQQAHQTMLPGSGAVAKGGHAPLGQVSSDIAATVRESAAVQTAIDAAKAEVTHAANALSSAGAPDIAAIIHKELGAAPLSTATVTATATYTVQAPAPPHTTGAKPAASAPAPGPHNLSIPGGDLFGYVPPMGLEEAEAALTVARRESESLDKKLVALIRKNRRLLLAGGN